MFKRINIRRGLKITPGYKEADLHHLKEYMKYVKDFYDKYFMKHPEKINSIQNFLLT